MGQHRRSPCEPDRQCHRSDLSTRVRPLTSPPSPLPRCSCLRRRPADERHILDRSDPLRHPVVGSRQRCNSVLLRLERVTRAGDSPHDVSATVEASIPTQYRWGTHEHRVHMSSKLPTSVQVAVNLVADRGVPYAALLSVVVDQLATSQTQRSARTQPRHFTKVCLARAVVCVYVC